MCMCSIIASGSINKQLLERSAAHVLHSVLYSSSSSSSSSSSTTATDVDLSNEYAYR